MIWGLDMSKHSVGSHRRRVVITGMGAITPVGHSVQDTWEALVAGKSGVVRFQVFDSTPFDCQIAGELRGFDARDYLPAKRVRQMAFSSQLAVIAADQAFEDAALDLASLDRSNIGVLLGTAGGTTIEESERATQRVGGQWKNKLPPYQMIRVWPNMPAFFVADTYRLGGYNGTICTACAAATQAIGEAAEVIRRGAADVMVAGGTESLVSKIALAGFTSIRALSTSYNDEPSRAMRPFDANREGFVSGQGCAILVLEDFHHAQERDAPIYAEVLGFGVSSDIYHMIAPDPEAKGAALALRRAIETAGVAPDQVDYINAHGTSTPLGDAAETRAIKTVFGEHSYRIPISSTKSMTGHLMGAGGAVEAVVCVKSIQEGVIHPTINYETPDPECDLDYVPNEARSHRVRVAVSNSFGLGGQNAVLVFGAV
jgi:3-oxoacyl-[acyl-carrier-protein] synthase II